MQNNIKSQNTLSGCEHLQWDFPWELTLVLSDIEYVGIKFPKKCLQSFLGVTFVSITGSIYICIYLYLYLILYGFSLNKRISQTSHTFSARFLDVKLEVL